MDAAEQIVNRLLSDMGHKSIVFEPDGNIPPDFAIEGRIAVEVRRLTQIHDDGSKTRALAEVSIPLTQQVEKLINSIQGNGQGSWWVSFGYRRPVPPWKQLEPELRQALETFISSANKRSGRLYESPHFDMDVRETSTPFEKPFVLAVIQDHEAGGWVVGEFLKCINFCIEEKTKKVAKAKHKYDEWWLALVNFTGMALDERDRGQLLENLQPHSDWDKVLIVTASDPPKYFEC